MPAATAGRMAMLALAIAAWLASFAILLRLGTWTPFALAGPTLAALALRCDAAARALLRPSLGRCGVGLLAGLLMVAFTHAAFALVTPLWPATRTATVRLFELLHAGGHSSAAQAGLIAVIAVSEEIVFRGALAAPPIGGSGRGASLRIVSLAAAYALATVTLGSPLLAVCAFGCGIVWGALRVATRSLLAPIVAHVIWDLGVLVAWPLVVLAGPTGWNVL